MPNAHAAMLAGLDFTSDRMRLLKPFLTENVILLALNRMIMDEKMPKDTPHQIKKLALWLVRELNPLAYLDNEEEGVLRGMDRKTVGKLKAAGEL